MASTYPDAFEVSGRKKQPKTGCDDANTGVSCDPCHSNKKSSNAEYYCVMCDEFMCTFCAETHRGTRASKNHRLLGRDEMPRKRLTEGNFCSVHDHKIFEFHCKTHDVLCCTDCFVSTHVGCPVDKVNDIANQFDKSGEYLTLNKQINTLEKELENLNNESQANLVNQERSYKKFLFEINDFRNDINEVLDSLESSVKKTAETRKQNGDKSMRLISSHCDDMTSELKTMSTSLREQEKYKLNHHLVLTAKKTQKQVSLLEKRAAVLESGDKVGDYIFRRNAGIVHMLQSVTSLGTMSDKQDKQSQIQVRVPLTNSAQDAMNEYAAVGNSGSIRDQSSDQIETIVGTTRDLHIQPHITFSANKICAETTYLPLGTIPAHVSSNVEKSSSIYIKCDADKDDCWITGSVKMNEDTLVVIDHRNQNIKAVHSPTGGIGECTSVKQYGKPWDITYANHHNQLVVTCAGGLVFISKHVNRFMILLTVKLGEDCRGIDFHNNFLYVACISPQPAVKIVSMIGVELRCLSIDNQGNKLFLEPWYITLSKDIKYILVSDKGQNSVICFTMEFQPMGVYRHEKLEMPHGLTVDDNDNVYIAGCYSHNIHMLTSDRSQAQIVLQGQDGAVCPQSITWSQDQLFVSHGYGNLTNIISVFKS